MTNPKKSHKFHPQNAPAGNPKHEASNIMAAALERAAAGSHALEALGKSSAKMTPFVNERRRRR